MKKVVDFPGSVICPINMDVDDHDSIKKGDKISFTKFLTLACKGYGRFAKGPDMARQYSQIMDVIEGVNGDKSITFGESDFALVRAAVDDSGWGSTDLNRAFIPFYDAMDNVKEYDETSKKE